jgi:hypothetical protein
LASHSAISCCAPSSGFGFGPGRLELAHGRRERDRVQFAGQPCVDFREQLLLAQVHGGRMADLVLRGVLAEERAGPVRLADGDKHHTRCAAWLIPARLVSPRCPADVGRVRANARVQAGISEAAGALSCAQDFDFYGWRCASAIRGTWRWLTHREKLFGRDAETCGIYRWLRDNRLPRDSSSWACPATTPRARANGARSRISTARSTAMPVTRSSCR